MQKKQASTGLQRIEKKRARVWQFIHYVSLGYALLLGVPSLSHAAVVELPSLTVLADQSLSVPLTEIARAYSAANKTTVNVSFAPARIQAARIEEGEAADLVISAHPGWIGELKAQGLIDIYSQTPLAKNRLVLAGNAKSTLMLKLEPNLRLADAIKSVSREPFLVVGDPEYLVEGIYTQEALDRLNLRAGIEPIIFRFRDINHIRRMIAEQNAFGILYKTNVLHTPNIKIIDIFPESAHVPIIYQAAVVAGDNMAEARRFLAYLSGEQAALYFTDDGFEPVAKPVTAP